MAKTIKSDRQIAQREEKKARDAWETSDSFQNFALKLGMGTDNTLSQSTYGFNPITRVRTLLEWIYRGAWLGQLAVDVVANDMTRAGIEVLGKMPPDDIEELNEAAVRWGIWPSVNETVKWSRLYGGCIAVIMIDGQDMETPLRLETVGKDQFKGLLVLDRWMVEPSLETLVGDLGPNLGLPKYYRVTATAPALIGKRVHFSRCLRLEGVKLPYWQRVMENLWGVSVYEPLYDRMVAFDSATQGAAQLTYKSHLRTMKVKDLREIASSGGAALTGLTQYVDMMRRFQSNEGITLLDAEDDMMVTQAGGYTGISDILLQFGQQLSGALQIPLVRLFGQSPAGLSSTGESDLRTYYDGISQRQNETLLVPMTKIYRILAQSEGIKVPDGFRVKFKPLWQLSDTEKGNVVTAVTGAIVSAQEAGIIGRKTAMMELRQSSEVTGVFSNITDEDIDDADNDPPPGEEALAPEEPLSKKPGEEADPEDENEALGSDTK